MILVSHELIAREIPNEVYEHGTEEELTTAYQKYQRDLAKERTVIEDTDTGEYVRLTEKQAKELMVELFRRFPYRQKTLDRERQRQHMGYLEWIRTHYNDDGSRVAGVSGPLHVPEIEVS